MRSMTEFFSNIELGVDTFKTINGNEFTVTSVDDKHINISIPGNATVNKLTLSLDEVRKMLESGQKFDKIKDVTTFFGKSYDRQKVIEQNKKNAVRHAYFREYLALELSLDETDDLLERAGYALSHASKFDVIVEYFIVSGKYNIFDINEVLFKYDQPLLGG